MKLLQSLLTSLTKQTDSKKDSPLFMTDEQMSVIWGGRPADMQPKDEYWWLEESSIIQPVA